MASWVRINRWPPAARRARIVITGHPPSSDGQQMRDGAVLSAQVPACMLHRWTCGALQDATAKECGLHSGNIVQSAAEQAGEEQRDLFTTGGPYHHHLAKHGLLRTHACHTGEWGGGALRRMGERRRGQGDAGAMQQLDHDAAAALAAGRRDRDTLLVLYAPWCQFSQVPPPPPPPPPPVTCYLLPVAPSAAHALCACAQQWVAGGSVP